MASSSSAEEIERAISLLNVQWTDLEKTLIHIHWYKSTLKASTRRPPEPHLAGVAKFLRESLGDAIFQRWGIILHHRSANGENTILNIYGEKNSREGEPKSFVDVQIDTGLPDNLIETHYFGSVTVPLAIVIDAAKDLAKSEELVTDDSLIDTSCQKWVEHLLEVMRWCYHIYWLPRVNSCNTAGHSDAVNPVQVNLGFLAKMKITASLMQEGIIDITLWNVDIVTLFEMIDEQLPMLVSTNTNITVNLRWAKFKGINSRAKSDQVSWGVLMSFQETDPYRAYHCAILTYAQDHTREACGMFICHWQDWPRNIVESVDKGTVKWWPKLLLSRYVTLLAFEWNELGSIGDETKFAQMFFDSVIPVYPAQSDKALRKSS